MNHSPFHEAALDALERVVGHMGGRVLDELCRSTELPAVPHRGVETAYTCGCGGKLFSVPFDTGEAGVETVAFANVCGTCDAATRFPRLKPTGQEPA